MKPLVVIVSVILLLGFLGGAGYLIFFGLTRDAETGAEQATISPAPEPTDQPKKTILGTVREVTARGNENMERVDEVLADLEEATPPPPAALEEVVEKAPAPPPPPPPVETAPAPPSQPTLNPEVAAFVDYLSISGVRISQTGAKLLANGTFYTQGAYLNEELGIRFIGVDSTTSEVLFEDQNGFLYRRDY